MFTATRLVATAAVGAALLGSMPAFAEPMLNLNPYCQNARGEGLVLSFQNARIYAPQGAERIPLKMMISRACGVDERMLENIERVVVVGQSYTQYSILWLEGDSIQSYSQYLYANGGYGRGGNGGYNGPGGGRFGDNRIDDRRGGRDDNRVVFDLNGYTRGRLQLLVQGDMILDRIKVDVRGMMPPPPPGPGPFPPPPGPGPFPPPPGPGPHPGPGPFPPPPGPGPRPGPGPQPGPFPGPQPGGFQTYQIECSSIDGRSQFCQVPGLMDVRLVSQLSQSPCIQGRTFMFQQNQGISVMNGCRGVFQVTARR